MVSLNRAVAVAMVPGPAAGLDLLAALESDRRLAGITGCTPPGRTCWRMPGTPRPRRPATGRPRRATSLPERRYLTAQARPRGCGPGEGRT